jgi:hypothetical protein
MAYLPLIDAQLKMAFRTAKDLAVTAVFEKTVSSDFDFNAMTAVVAVEPVEAQIIVFDGAKSSDKSNTETRQFMVRAKDVGDIKAFDKVVFDSKSWTIGRAIKGTGFILVFDAIREG